LRRLLPRQRARRQTRLRPGLSFLALLLVSFAPCAASVDGLVAGSVVDRAHLLLRRALRGLARTAGDVTDASSQFPAALVAPARHGGDVVGFEFRIDGLGFRAADERADINGPAGTLLRWAIFTSALSVKWRCHRGPGNAQTPAATPQRLPPNYPPTNLTPTPVPV